MKRMCFVMLIMFASLAIVSVFSFAEGDQPEIVAGNVTISEEKIKELEKDDKAAEVLLLQDELEAQKNSLDALRAEYDHFVIQTSAEKEKLYLELGAAYIKAKMFVEAISAYEALIKFNPKNAQAHYALGLLYKQQENDYVKAIDHLKQYLKYNPGASDKADIEYLIQMLQEH